MTQLTLPTTFQMILGLYAYLLPLLLCALWAALALWDLETRTELPLRAYILWAAVVLLVPFFGPLAYHSFAKTRLSARIRLTAVAGGLGLYALVLLLGNSVGGIT
jgi:hypothetical protein